MFASLMKSFAQAGDPAFRTVFLRSLWLSLGVFVALWALAWFGLAWLGQDLAAWIAQSDPDSAWVRDFEWAYSAAAVAGLAIAGHLDRFVLAVDHTGKPLSVSLVRMSILIAAAFYAASSRAGGSPSADWVMRSRSSHD